MSWQISLQDASFKGIIFDCLGTDDGSSRAVARYEYPYVDGADTEDQGRGPREFSMTAVFFGLFYETALNTFIAKLDEPGVGELIHPIFGSLPQVQLLSHQIHHDVEQPDYATVQLSFLEHRDSNPFFSTSSPLVSAVSANFALSQSWLATVQGYAGFAQALTSAVVGGALGLVSSVTALGSLTGGVMNALRVQFPGSTATATDYVAAPEAFGADVASAVGGLSDSRTFQTSPMSDWRSMYSDAVTITALPGQIAMGMPVPGVTSEPIAITAPDLAQVDSLVTTAVANDVADTATQLLQAQLDEPTLSPVDIEQLAGDARSLINTAIAKHRASLGSVSARDVTEPLKTAALAIQDLAASVINLRPPLIQRRVESPGNLHLLAFHWYGDYRRAEELLRLNTQLRNPNDIQLGDMLHGYSR